MELESRSASTELQKAADDLLQLSPYSRQAVAAKVQALCRLKKWPTAKAVVEEWLARTHVTILAVGAHPQASWPPPPASQLAFHEAPAEAGPTVGARPLLVVNSAALVQALLCMGKNEKIINKYDFFKRFFLTRTLPFLCVLRP